MSDTYKKLSETIGISTEGQDTKFLVNNQWTFILPALLEYEVDGEIEDINHTKVRDLVLREPDSKYLVPFCAAVNEHHPILPEYMTALDCKYDNRFAGDTGDNLHEIITDTPELYVDLTSVDMWPFGLDMEVRVRGESIVPFDIHKIVKVPSRDNKDHLYDIFKEIAQSIEIHTDCAVKAKQSTDKAAKKQRTTPSDPDCIMDGTVLCKYIGSDKDIVLPEGITELPDMIFSGRSDIHSVIVPEGVTAIGRRAFENCFNLEEVVLPKSLKSLGGYAFVDCHSLKSIYLSSKIKRIEDSTFSDCVSLENVVIPKSVNYIDGFAFARCSSFTKIILPDGLTDIGWYAFAGCSNLEYIYIPSTVTDIQTHPTGVIAFADCPKLTIHCLAGTYAGQFAEENGIPYIIESEPPKPPRNNRTSAKSHAPSGQKTTLAKPAKQAYPPANFAKGKMLSFSDLFMSGTEINGYYGEETKIILPDGVTKIGNSAFDRCESLTSIAIPEGVTDRKSVV